MIEANTAKLVQWPPALMARFGAVPVGGGAFAGKNLYRLIWAPSREVTLVLDCGRRTFPLYVSVEPLKNPMVWVLEKWVPVDKVTSATKEEWEANAECRLMGPYPADGDYVMAGLPLTCEPANANIDKLISWIEANDKFTAAQHAIALQNDLDRKEKDKDRIREGMIRDRLLPFGGEAWSGRTSRATGRNGRGTKIVKQNKTANELGLPVTPGIYPGMSVRPTVHYQVPVKD